MRFFKHLMIILLRSILFKLYAGSRLIVDCFELMMQGPEQLRVYLTVYRVLFMHCVVTLEHS